MKLVPLEFHGVHVMAPEEFLCAVLRWPERDRILPIWLSPIEGGRVAARDEGYQPRRPDTHDLLIEALEAQGGINSITITSHFEGVFVVEIVTASGDELDARVSDALILSKHFDVPVEMEEDMLLQTAVYVSDEDMEANFHFTFGPHPDQPMLDLFEEGANGPGSADSMSASGDKQADKAFSDMMRSLGMSEEDFAAGFAAGAAGEHSKGENTRKKDTDVSDVANDAEGDEED